MNAVEWRFGIDDMPCTTFFITNACQSSTILLQPSRESGRRTDESDNGETTAKVRLASSRIRMKPPSELAATRLPALRRRLRHFHPGNTTNAVGPRHMRKRVIGTETVTVIMEALMVETSFPPRGMFHRRSSTARLAISIATQMELALPTPSHPQAQPHM